jgi:quinol monooxygenase YgiN
VLIIEGSLTFDESDRDDVLRSLRQVTEHSRRDAGCVEYWWAEDIDCPNTFRFFECWESQEFFDAHVSAPHERVFGERNLGRIKDATARIFSATDAP